MTDPDALEQQAHSALDMLAMILRVDVTVDADLREPQSAEVPAILMEEKRCR